MNTDFFPKKLLIILLLLSSCTTNDDSIDEYSSLPEHTSITDQILIFTNIDGSTLSVKVIESDSSFSAADLPKYHNYRFSSILPDQNKFLNGAGTVGISTPINQVPTEGDFLFNGETFVIISDSQSTYNLEGSASVGLTFNNTEVGYLNATLSELNGNKTASDLSVINETILDVGEITFKDLLICNGNQICNGNVQISSEKIIGNLSGNQIMKFIGTFNGPQAEEIASSFTINDTKTGTLSVQGLIITKQ